MAGGRCRLKCGGVPLRLVGSRAAGVSGQPAGGAPAQRARLTPAHPARSRRLLTNRRPGERVGGGAGVSFRIENFRSRDQAPAWSRPCLGRANSTGKCNTSQTSWCLAFPIRRKPQTTVFKGFASNRKCPRLTKIAEPQVLPVLHFKVELRKLCSHAVGGAAGLTHLNNRL